MTIKDRVKLNSKIKFPSPLSRADMKSIEREREREILWFNKAREGEGNASDKEKREKKNRVQGPIVK